MVASVQLSDLRFLAGGYCVCNEYWTGVSSRKSRKFHAVFLHFTHPTHGQCVIDTGYGPDIVAQTRALPWRLLRWATPIPADQAFMQANYWAQQRLVPESVAYVFLSHLHADHIAAAKAFRTSQFIARRNAYEQLSSLPALMQLHHGFVPGLLPDDFDSRTIFIEEQDFFVSEEQVPYLRSYDYWGDGSLVLIDLPGHALGHTGYLLNTTDGKVLYVTDAFWDRRAFTNQQRLPWLSRRVHHSYESYCDTQQKLHDLCRTSQLEPIACHCKLTEQHVH